MFPVMPPHLLTHMLRPCPFIRCALYCSSAGSCRPSSEEDLSRQAHMAMRWENSRPGSTSFRSHAHTQQVQPCSFSASQVRTAFDHRIPMSYPGCLSVTNLTRHMGC